MVAAVTNQVVAYRARNLVNGKHYIGVTKRGLGRREHEHRYAARMGSTGTLHKAIRKYGEQIVFEVIFDFDGDYELAMLYEAEVVEKERPAYNLVPGGRNRTGPFSALTLQRMRDSHKGLPNARKGVKMPAGYVSPRTGKRHSEAAKAKMSATQKALFAAGRPGSMTGRKHTPEAIEKSRLARLGKPGPWAGKKRPEAGVWLSAARRGKPSWNVGRKMSAEAKVKMIAAKTGVPQKQTPAVLAARAINYAKMVASKRKPVICLNDGRRFDSVNDVLAAYEVSLSSVIRVLKGRYPSVKGLRFAYGVPSSL